MRWPSSFLTVSEALLKGVTHESRSTTTESDSTRTKARFPCGQAGKTVAGNGTGQQADISGARYRSGDQAGDTGNAAEARSITISSIWLSPAKL